MRQLFTCCGVATVINDVRGILIHNFLVQIGKFITNLRFDQRHMQSPENVNLHFVSELP